MKKIYSLALFIAFLLTLSACSQTSKSIPKIEEAGETALFTSADLRNAILVNELSTKEFHSLDLKNDETGVELPFLDEDEEISELATQGVITGASGWLALYRVRDSDGLNQIRLYDQSNSANNITVYSGTDAVESVAVSANGKTVVAAIVNPAHPNNRRDIYLFALNFTPVQVYQLTNTSNQNESNVSITANGITIAYQRRIGGLQAPYICTYDRITHSCNGSIITDTVDQIQPSISTYGKYLTLVKLLSNGNYQVGLYDLTASPNPTYTTIKTRKDVLAHPSVSVTDINTKVMYLWERSSDSTDYIRIKNLTSNTYSTELKLSAGLDHPFITRYPIYATYQQFKTPSAKYQVRTRELVSNTITNPEGGPWEYFSPFWMIPYLSCGMGTTVTGDKTLKNQAQVDALEGVSTITGNLILKPKNSDLDLSPLYLLTNVGGKLELENNSLQTTLSGFECLTTIGSSFRIYYNPNLSSMSNFPLLASVGNDFRIFNNNNLSNIPDFPLLASVGNDFRIIDNNNLSSIPDFPILGSVGNDFRIINNDNLSSIPNFPILDSVGNNFIIASNASISNISNFPILFSVGNTFYIGHNPNLSNIPNFPFLASVGNNFNISGNDNISNIPNFPFLVSVGNTLEFIGNDNLSSIAGFPLLANIGNSFYIKANNNLSSIPSFPLLANIGGTFSITYNGSLSSIAGFPLLFSVGSTFNIAYNNISSTPNFPSLVSIGHFFDIGFNDKLSNIGNFPLLSSVGTYFSISNNANLSSIPNFPLLTSVGSYFHIFNNASLSSIPSFPLLTSVGGSFYIFNNASLSSIPSFPFLTSVASDFHISNNTNLSSITGFNQLIAANITGVSKISNNPLLNCNNPVPNFVPINFSTGNLVNCQ